MAFILLLTRKPFIVKNVRKKIRPYYRNNKFTKDILSDYLLALLAFYKIKYIPRWMQKKREKHINRRRLKPIKLIKIEFHFTSKIQIKVLDTTQQLPANWNEMICFVKIGERSLELNIKNFVYFHAWNEFKQIRWNRLEDAIKGDVKQSQNWQHLTLLWCWNQANSWKNSTKVVFALRSIRLHIQLTACIIEINLQVSWFWFILFVNHEQN